MTKTDAIKKTLEQAFWSIYPHLDERQDYQFEDLFPHLDSALYTDAFWQLIDSNTLPLIPVIPLQNNGTVTQYGLDYH